ncbi:LON peptidase substrate-binding domain-containing protein [Litoribacillus peritrichatus]|uniref:LON peptidase substrate-binding domain-containing protein n=1 Tax=Litoribacillus peritrichatus TaxID=718191 RepID=A0ABP7MGX3_9GAMM
MNHFPVFPLNAVVYPGMALELKIFEPRYLDMVAECFKGGYGFIVALNSEDKSDVLSEGFEPVGTLVRIIDFTQLKNGMLGITVEGVERARLDSPFTDSAGLIRADMEQMNAELKISTEMEHEELVVMLKHLEQHPAIKPRDIEYDDASSVSWRLAELLPFDAGEKQLLLEMNHPYDRLDEIYRLLDKYQS